MGECSEQLDDLMTSVAGPIDIWDPPELSSGELAEVPILSGCKINVKGGIDTGNWPEFDRELRGIWAHVGAGAEVAGTITGVGNTWEVNGVPGVHWSVTPVLQEVFVRGVFHDVGPVERKASRKFKSTSGDPGCQYYYMEGGPSPSHGAIQEVMPRYFKVSAEFGGPQSFGLMAGGLLSQGALFLGYDSATSTPEHAVWRDIGLPTSVGSWLLRVMRIGRCGYEARLSVQTATETCVMPAANFLTRNWSFRKRNLFHGSLPIGQSKFDVTLIVEPS